MVLQGAFQEDEDSEMLPGMDDIELTGYLGESTLGRAVWAEARVEKSEEQMER